MFLLILDKNPDKSAELVPDRLKFKQMLELGQLICSAGISNVFKPIKQGKELQVWIKNNKNWIYWYMMFLFNYCINHLNLKFETIYKLKEIIRDLHNSIDITIQEQYPKNAIFRYKQGYKSQYNTNSELPIDIAVKEYRKYVKWKEKQYDLRRIVEKV